MDINIGDKFRVLGTHESEKFYIKCRVKEIYQKKFYNMYLCESQRGLKITFNDYDLHESMLRSESTSKYCPKVKKGW